MVEKEHALEYKRLLVTPKKCIGCRTCELSCSFVHSDDAAHLRQSRVRVHDCGGDVFVPILCLQCDEAACVKACPVNALQRNEQTQAIEVDNERCVRCMACVPACPFGNMTFDDTTGVVVKCDVCGGRPACALFCPTKALEYR